MLAQAQLDTTNITGRSPRVITDTLPLFRGLDAARVDRLLTAASVDRYAKGENLFAAGEKPERLHVVLNGSVEAYACNGGRDRTTLIFFASDIVLPAAALVEEPYLLSARAVKRSTLLSLRLAAVQKEMAAGTVLANHLVTILSGQLRITLRHVMDMQSRSGAQRLAAYLLRLVDDNGSSGEAALPFSKGMLASRLGMTAESFSRAIQKLSRRGLLVRGRRALVKDRAAIEHYCQQDPLIDSDEQRLGVRVW